MIREANSIPVDQKVVKELTGIRAPAKQYPKLHSPFEPGHPSGPPTLSMHKLSVSEDRCPAHQQDGDPVLGSSTCQSNCFSGEPTFPKLLECSFQSDFHVLG